ncbi:MAG: hypothetical protein NC910_00670 [Candidatus Omnitrophica bacterium]|nr:hypothetical protein [Candidatus Omnitrophota bacterium]
MPRTVSVLVVTAVRQEMDRSVIGADPAVRVLVTGVGQRNVHRSLGPFLRENAVRLLISAGFSGGVRPGYRVGDLVMASEVLDEHSAGRWKPSKPPESWNGRIASGPFITASSVVRSSASKKEIGMRTAAAAVDMESAAVAALAEAAGVPWVAIRAILDPMEADLMVGSLPEACALMMRPSRWADLRRFLASVKVARRSLAEGIRFLMDVNSEVLQEQRSN